MLEAYVTHTSDKNSGGKNFGIFQAIAGVGIFWATMIYPMIKSVVYPIVPLATIGAMAVLFLCTFFVTPDTLHHQEHPKKSINQIYAALFETLKKWWHFVKVNQYYPVFYMSYAFFRWFVYTALLFLIPLHLMNVKSGNVIDGLPIGIYELLVIFFGWICGYFADKVDRRTYNILGWGLIVLGFLGMIRWHDTTGLVILGFIAGMGRNIMYAASTHILEEKDIDHKEDTDFTALERSILKVGSVIAPLILGPVYQYGGFQMGIIVLSILMAGVGGIMIYHTRRFSK
jgi:predicted MFS family arabinose efflux permease